MTTFTTTFALTGASQAGSLRLRQIGSLTDADFTTTLVQALQASVKPGLTFDGVDKLSFTDTFTGPIVITRMTSTTPAVGATHCLQMFDVPVAIHAPQATITGIVGAPTLPTYPSILKGINLSGMEFSGDTAFIPDNATVDYYVTQGFTCIRLPCLWQRMQPVLFGDLATDGSTLLADKYKAVVNYIVSKGIVCIVDSAHNYGKRPEGKIGSAEVPVSSFDDYCIKLYKFLGAGSGKIIYDLMNEPPDANWGSMASSHAAAIRSAGCLNRLHVSYTESSLAAYSDPLANTLLDVHKYLDPTLEGISGICTVGAGSSRLTAIIAAAKAAGKRLFLGEFAGGYPSVAGQEQCATEIPAIIDAVQNNSDVWAGWAAWGGGRYWTSTYVYRLEYGDGSTVDTPYMTILKNKLVITPPAPTSIVLTPSATISAVRGQTGKISAQVLPAGASQAVTWGTSNAARAAIDQTGTWTVPANAAAGTSILNARTSTGIEKTVSITVTVP